jgi:hypothetical protein
VEVGVKAPSWSFLRMGTDHALVEERD